jgi:glycosyltransferase involved in cell wall biosynthesis
MPESRRVLVATDEMEVGGSQRQVTHLLIGLADAGWTPELLYFRTPSFLIERVQARGIAVNQIRKRYRFDLRFFLDLVRFLRQRRFDVVHCFSLTAEAWVWLALCFAPGSVFVASMRYLGFDHSRFGWIVKRFVCRNANAVISNSRAGVDAVRERTGIDPARIAYVPNGVELPPAPLAPAVRSALAPDWNGPVLLYVGRLVEQKSVDVLLDALARVPPTARPRAWIAGDGPLRADLEAQAARLGLASDVTFLGMQRDAQSLMAQSDFVVVPSRDEGLSNVLLEAMAAERPVIASRAGGNAELVSDGDNGLLFDVGDTATLARCIERLSSDAGLRARLGVRARQRASGEFSIGAMVEATVGVYLRGLHAT